MSEFYVCFSDVSPKIVGWGRTVREGEAAARRELMQLGEAEAAVRCARASKRLYDELSAGGPVTAYDRRDGIYVSAGEV